jgi:hypothetical protein
MEPQTTSINLISQRWKILGRIKHIGEAREIRSLTEEKRYQWQIVIEYKSREHTNCIALQVFESPVNLKVGAMVQALFSVEAVEAHKTPGVYLNFLNGHHISVIEQ